MSDLTRVASSSEIPIGAAKAYALGGLEVAVFNVDGQFFAIDDRCPHSGASLALGTLEAGVITCPWHAWKFNLQTGDRVGAPGMRVRQYPASLRDGDVWIDASGATVAEKWDGIHRYLVRYGALGWVGRFGSVEKVDCSYRDRVVVQTSRGLEIGEVLAPPTNGAGELDRERPAGEVVRLLRSEDEQMARSLVNESQAVFDACQRLLQERGLPIEVVDSEPLLDGITIVLYFLGDNSPILAHVAEELGKNCEARIVFHPVIDPAPEQQNGGCGAGGCGCQH